MNAIILFIYLFIYYYYFFSIRMYQFDGRKYYKQMNSSSNYDLKDYKLRSDEPISHGKAGLL